MPQAVRRGSSAAPFVRSCRAPERTRVLTDPASLVPMMVLRGVQRSSEDSLEPVPQRRSRRCAVVGARPAPLPRASLVRRRRWRRAGRSLRDRCGEAVVRERLGRTGEVTRQAATAQPAGMGDDPLLAADRAGAAELLDRTWSGHACPRPSVLEPPCVPAVPGFSRFIAVLRPRWRRATAQKPRPGQRPAHRFVAREWPPNPVIAVTAVISLIPGFRRYYPDSPLPRADRCSRLGSSRPQWRDGPRPGTLLPLARCELRHHRYHRKTRRAK